MKPWIWLRTLAVVTLVFAAGHTLGTALPHTPRGPQEATVLAAMQGSRFHVMGFDRSYWDFYRGFALTISLALLVLAILAWQAGTRSKSQPGEALPMAATFLLYFLGQLVLAWKFFFWGPLTFSILAALVSGVAVAAAVRARLSPGRA